MSGFAGAIARAAAHIGLISSFLLVLGATTAMAAPIESILVKPLPKGALQSGTGWVDVNKFVINITGSGAPIGFPATVVCTGSQGTHSYPLTLHDSVMSPFAAHIGDSCTITEAAVPNSSGAAHCPGSQEASWQPYYFPSATFTVSGAHATEPLVLNIASCAKSDKGSLIVSALGIVNATGGPWPASVFSSFPYTIGTHVTCTPNGPTNAPLPLSSSFPAFLTNTVPNLATGSQCSVVQDNPFPPVTDATQCASGTAHWETSYSPPTVTIVANQFVSITIVNTLVCDASKASLTVVKKIVDSGNGVPPPPTVFTAAVNCPPGASQTVTLSPSSNYQATVSVASSSACTVTENPPPPLDASYLRKGCYWQQDTGNPTGIKTLKAKGDSTRYLVNDWVCRKGGNGGTGSLDVIKKIVNDSAISPPDTVFLADVNCQPGGHIVTLELSSGNGFHNIATGIAMGATCTISEQAPPVPADLARKGCHWVTDYTNGQKFSVGDLVKNSAEIVNHWTCKGDNGNTGSLPVFKKIENDASIAPPDTVFIANVNCTPGGASVGLELSSGNGFHNIATGLQPGSACTVVEQPPAVPPDLARRGCHWETEYPSGQTFRIGDARKDEAEIVNHWICKGNGNAGTLDVFKKVENDASIPPPPTIFYADVQCQPGGPNVTLELSDGNGFHNTATGIAMGAACTVTEQPPAVPAELARKGCHWETEYTGGQRFRIGDLKANKAEIVNHWICKGQGTGTFTIIKKVINESNITPPDVPFTIDVTCQPGGPQTTVTLSSANNWQQTLTGLAAGATCTTTEEPPPVPADLARRGCHWEMGPGPIYAGDKPRIAVVDPKLTRTIFNRWICKGDNTGTLTIIKKVVSDGPVPPPDVNFVIDVNCQPGGSQTSVTLNSGNNWQQTLSGLATGAVCTTTEEPPQVPPEYKRRGCYWESDHPVDPTHNDNGGRRTPAAGDKNTRIITNYWVCKGDKDAGHLSLFKTVVNNTGGPVPTMPSSFDLTAHCGVTNTTVHVPANNGVSLAAALAAGTTCTVTETSLPSIDRLKQCKGQPAVWTTTYSPAVNIAAGGNVTLTATNTLTCGGDTGTGTLTIIKKVVSDGPIPAPDVNFVMDVTCQPGGPQPSVTLNSSNNWQQTITTPAGATCTVTEETPAVPAEYARRGCHWETDGTTGTGNNGGPRMAPVDDKHARVITNHWVCKGDKDTGHLSLYKTVVNNTGGPVPTMPSSFDLTAHCGALSQTVHVPANNGVSLAAAIAAGTTCTVTEASLPNIDRLKQCKGQPAVWTTTYSPAVTIPAGGNATLTATNTLACGKGGPGDGDGGYDLGLAKACSPCATTMNGTVNFTLTGTSLGDPVGQGAVQIVDTLPAGLTPTSASGSGWSCTISGQTVTCNYVGPGVGNGQTFVPISIAATAGQAGTYDNSAIINFVGGYEGDLGNNTAHATVIVRKGGDTGTKYDAGIVKTADGTWVSGNAGVFRLVVTNYGAAVPGGTISVTDTLPPGMTLVGGAGSGWSCGSSNPVTCTYSGSVAQGQTLPPLLITVTLSGMGHATNTAVVSMSSVSDSVPGNNASTITVNVSPPSLIGNGGNGGAAGMTRTHGSTILVGVLAFVTSGPVSPGGTGTFELSVMNNGDPLPESANFMVHSMLPSGLMLGSVSADGSWTCRTSGNDMSCRLMGTAPTGTLPKIRFSAKTREPGTFNVCASVYLVTVKDSTKQSCTTLRVGLDQPKGIPQPPPLIIPPPHPKKDGPPPAPKDTPPVPAKGKP
jgi:uncharacterized repeat protein (TIGR01451 family)